MATPRPAATAPPPLHGSPLPRSSGSAAAMAAAVAAAQIPQCAASHGYLHLGDSPKIDGGRGFRPFLRSCPAVFSGISLMDSPRRRRGLRLQPCHSFMSEDGGGEPSEEKAGERARGVVSAEEGSRLQEKRKGGLSSLKSFIVGASGLRSQYEGQYKKAVEKAEATFFAFASHLGRYLVTMMSTGVILGVGFQLSGGDSQMNTLIWYSWLGGIVIGTMVGANMVLEEHYKAGPRNVVITGRRRRFRHRCVLLQSRWISTEDAGVVVRKLV